jgi:hypothetical protein
MACGWRKRTHLIWTAAITLSQCGPSAGFPYHLPPNTDPIPWPLATTTSKSRLRLVGNGGAPRRSRRQRGIQIVQRSRLQQPGLSEFRSSPHSNCATWQRLALAYREICSRPLIVIDRHFCFGTKVVAPPLHSSFVCVMKSTRLLLSEMSYWNLNADQVTCL